MHGAQRMSHHIDAGNGQHHAILRRRMLWMLLRIIVDAPRKGVQIAAELRILLFVPILRTLWHSVDADPTIQLNLRFAPVFSSASARLAVEPQQQIGMVLHLRPTVSVEHTLDAVGEDVRHAVAIP